MCGKDIAFSILSLKKVSYSRNVEFDEQENGPSVEEEESVQHQLILTSTNKIQEDGESGSIEELRAAEVELPTTETPETPRRFTRDRNIAMKKQPDAWRKPSGMRPWARK